MIDTPLVQVSIPVEVAKQLFPKGKDGSMNWQAVVQSLALAGITSNPKRLEMFTEVIKSKAKKDAFDAFTVKSKPTVKGKSKKTISSNEADYVLDMEATSKRGRRSYFFLERKKKSRKIKRESQKRERNSEEECE